MVRRNRASRRKRAGVKAGRTYKNLVGTRAEVMHGTAFKTSYGKTKSEGVMHLPELILNTTNTEELFQSLKVKRKINFLNSFVTQVTQPKKANSAQLKLQRRSTVRDANPVRLVVAVTSLEKRRVSSRNAN